MLPRVQWQYTRPGRAGQPPAKANYATFIDVIRNFTARLGASDAAPAAPKLLRPTFNDVSCAISARLGASDARSRCADVIGHEV